MIWKTVNVLALHSQTGCYGVRRPSEQKHHTTFSLEVDQKNILIILPEEPGWVLAHRELSNLAYVWSWFPEGRGWEHPCLQKAEVFKLHQTCERAEKMEEATSELPFCHIFSSGHLFLAFPDQHIFLWAPFLAATLLVGHFCAPFAGFNLN